MERAKTLWGKNERPAKKQRVCAALWSDGDRHAIGWCLFNYAATCLTEHDPAVGGRYTHTVHARLSNFSGMHCLFRVQCVRGQRTALGRVPHAGLGRVHRSPVGACPLHRCTLHLGVAVFGTFEACMQGEIQGRARRGGATLNLGRRAGPVAGPAGSLVPLARLRRPSRRRNCTSPCYPVSTLHVARGALRRGAGRTTESQSEASRTTPSLPAPVLS